MTSRCNIIIGNWKMNLLPEEAQALSAAIAPRTAALRCSQAWIAPTLLCLPAALRAASGTPLRVGVQNVHWADKGAFTGEVSAPMLRACGAHFAIVGHSERRHVFGESNELCARRALTPDTSFRIVFCIGETADQRSSQQTAAVIEAQLKPLFSELSAERVSSLLLAYEPVWAIGTGNVATPAQIADTHQLIRDLWSRYCQFPCPPVLYGGSVAPDNFQSIIELPGVDGALVGGASLAADKFIKLLEISEKTPPSGA